MNNIRRIISLLNTISKVLLEKSKFDSITGFNVKKKNYNGPIDEQFAFRRCHLTEHQVTRIADYI